jgi:hypothetical protein
VVPSGWNLVGFVGGNPSASCFTGSAGATVYEGPSGGSCTCGCTLGAPPTCPAGPIDVKYDVHAFGGNCNQNGTPATMNNMGACATDMYHPTGIEPGYNQLDLEFIPPQTGGPCTTTVTPNQGSVGYSSQDTVCTPSTTTCTPNMPCMPDVPSGYSVCIEQSGDQSCPTGSAFSQKYVVGGAATFTCGTGCNCTLPPCTGTMKLFANNSCNGTEYDIPASSAGTCVAPGNMEANDYSSYHYVPDQAPTACSSSGSSSPQNLQLTNPMTLCCAP